MSVAAGWCIAQHASGQQLKCVGLLDLEVTNRHILRVTQHAESVEIVICLAFEYYLTGNDMDVKKMGWEQGKTLSESTKEASESFQQTTGGVDRTVGVSNYSCMKGCF